MSVREFTVEEQLAEVERLIEHARRDDPAPGSEDERRLEILKSIAADVRGRLTSAPSVSLVNLERRLTLLARRTGPADRANAKIGAAEELVARWPTVKQALERHAAQLEQENSR